MSLIKIENTNYKLEFNDFEYLKFEDGWNGGQWSNWDVVNNPENYIIIVLKGDKAYKIEAKSVEITGSDSDMGHAYQWKSKRLLFKVESFLQDFWVDFSELDNIKVMYCKLEKVNED